MAAADSTVVHDISIKELNLKQKNQSQIFNYGPARQARQAKKKVAIENSLRLHTRGTPAASTEAV